MSSEVLAEPRSRRAILAALGGGFVALVAQAIGRPLPARAADGDSVIIGDPNLGETETSLTLSNDSTAFRAESEAGYGLHGVSVGGADVPKGTGVYGVSGNAADAATDTQQTGVYGYSETSDAANGIWGDSNATGVFGTGGNTGVQGLGFWGVVGGGDQAEGGVGVFGTGNTGVWAFPSGSAPHGAAANSGLSAEAPWPKNAAHFNGRTFFTRAGKLAITAGHYYVQKSIPLGSSSLVLAVVNSSSPGFWVVRVTTYPNATTPSASYFRAVLNATVPAGKTVTVAYFVVN